MPSHPSPEGVRGAGRSWMAALGLFGLALVVRLLFWAATPDSGWPGSAWYEGDARGWLAWAAALHGGQAYEADLPVRPPGAAYLIAALTGADPAASITWLKVVWCVLGALAAALFGEASRRSFCAGVGLTVGVICASSSGLMVLSTSLNNETPYLVLVAATLVLWSEVRERPRPWALAAWGALHGLACLVRVEHVLFTALMLALVAARWIVTSRRRDVVARLVLVSLGLGMTLMPWHLVAWAAIRRFNDDALPDPVAMRAIHESAEGTIAGIPWTDAARAEIGKLPAATRETARFFVAATVWVRGIPSVDRGLPAAILDEAFGTVPRPLPRHPFVSLYGPLNFFLANHALTGGGFDRGPLDRPPRLAGGVDRYPRPLVAGLPPPDLALTYPPHLQALEEGYRLGWEWIGRNPGDFARLAARKLAIFWRGAALGFGGYDLPLGLDGIRRNVDLVVPVGGAARAWRLGVGVFALTGLGLGVRRHRAALAPWLAYLLSKVVVTVAFFGYARQGAAVIPVVAVLGCLAVEPVATRMRRRAVPIVLAVAALLVGAEVWRYLHPPTVILDGRVAGTTDPLAGQDPRDVAVRVR